MCCHSARDARCGQLGPPLAAALRQLVRQRGLQDQVRGEPRLVSCRGSLVCAQPWLCVHLKHAARVVRELVSLCNSQTPAPINTQVSVLATSHIGGHKYAGNVIAYSAMHPCDGDWFGGVNAGNAAAFLDALLDVEVSRQVNLGRCLINAHAHFCEAGTSCGCPVRLALPHNTPLQLSSVLSTLLAPYAAGRGRRCGGPRAAALLAGAHGSEQGGAAGPV